MTEFYLDNKPKDYSKVEQIDPLVRRILAPNPSSFTNTGTGTYIIGRKDLAIIDPGPLIESHINNLLKKINHTLIKYIFITHTHLDHSPAAEVIKKLTGAKTYAHGPYPGNNDNSTFDEGHDKNFVPDIYLNDNDVIETDEWQLKAIHTPGHTSNHMCYGLENSSILFTGDHIMGWSTTVIVPPDGNMTKYVDSLKKIIKYNYKIYLPTHGSQITEPKKYVRALISHRKMRETQIINELKNKKLTVAEMVPKFYASTKKSLWKAAEKSLLATLISLEERQLICCSKRNKNSGMWSLKRNKC